MSQNLSNVNVISFENILKDHNGSTFEILELLHPAMINSQVNHETKWGTWGISGKG